MAPFRSRFSRMALLAASLFGPAFAQPQPLVAQISEQQIVAAFNGISQRAARLRPMLEQLHPNDWVAKGAPDTYVAQWNSTLEQLRAIEAEMSLLTQHPDQMSEGMKALFAIQRSRDVLSSLMGGLRKYQNPALADLIESVAAEDGNDLDRFQHYLLDLANQKEQQFAVVDHEAQRCRAAISREPAEPAPSNRRAR